MKLSKYIALVLTFALLGLTRSAAAQPSSSDTVGGLLRQDIDQIKIDEFEQRIKREREKREQQQDEQPETVEVAGPTVMIQEIQLDGVNIIPIHRLQPILDKYQGQELAMSQIQTLAREITAVYREDGYVTSRAYIPPQDMNNGVLKISVLEGRLGDIEIQGNKHFKTSLLEKKLDMRGDNQYFDYSQLQRSLAYINEHPDRSARAILLPGDQPKTTDIVIEVEDQTPFHFGIEFDNHVSRYIHRDRFGAFLEHNNLTGHDDRLEIKGYLTDGTLFKSGQLRYTFPVSQSFEAGFYALYSKSELGREFKILDANGKAQLYGIFASKDITKDDTLEVRLNVGFDYKDIENYLLGSTNSHDELRVLKGGFDFDFVDRFGRSILTTEINVGLPDFLGGSEDVDSMASRAGAGGEFQKGVFNFFRLQPMPFNTHILWKNSGQISGDTLVASEQFQIGGAKSVRGYEPAAYSGDKGFYSAIEWSVPIWGLSKELTVPFRSERLYDAIRLVAFYDIGFIDNKTPAVGEEANEMLHGYGFGFRFNLLDDLALRVEVGIPINAKTGDDGHQTWVEFKLRY